MVPSLEDRLGTESAPATHGWDEHGRVRVWGWASKHRWSCTAALRPSLPFAQRARGTLPYPDSSQWEPSPPLWAPHLPSLAGPHAPHLPSLAGPLPWLCSATSMQVSVAHGQGAARGRVFEWAAWEGGQAHLSCMGTCAQQLHNHTHNSSPKRHVPFQGQTTALPQAPALSLPDNCPTYGQHESPHSFHTQHRGAAEEAEPSSHLQVLRRPFSPSTGTAFQHALRPSLAIAPTHHSSTLQGEQDRPRDVFLLLPRAVLPPQRLRNSVQALSVPLAWF